jgi:hypothetical protein
MEMEDLNHPKHARFGEIYKLGFLLVGAGILMLLDQSLQTGWLTLSLPAIAGLLVAVYGAVKKNPGWVIGGSIVLGAGAGLITGVLLTPNLSPLKRTGAGLLAFTGGWILLTIFVGWIRRKVQWWGLMVTAAIGASGGYLFVAPKVSVIEYMVYLAASIGVIFLAWGVVEKKLGLIITGSILFSASPALNFAWVNNSDPSNLVKTGTMLVWLALGWLLISFMGRVVFQKFLWWPIIPGGVLAMVGWGLYIGGAAGKSLGFIGNTGSVALILFGIYLITLKYGMRK